MDKRVLQELLEVLDDTPGDVVQAKVEAMNQGDSAARLGLIAKCIWAAQRKGRSPMMAGIALEHTLRLTGYEPSDLI